MSSIAPLIFSIFAAVTPAPARPAGATGTVVVPDRFLRRFDPVTIFFTSDRGKPGPEDHAEKFASLSPSHPGAFTWLDARTLQFRPAEPWPPLARVRVKVDQRETVLSTLMEAPISTVPPEGATGLEHLSEITLTFSEPLDKDAALKSMLSVELRPLPGIDSTGARYLKGEDFDVKRQERHARSENASYVLDFHHPLPLATRVVVHLRLSLDDKSTQSFSEFSISTAEPFRVVGVGSLRERYPVNPEGSRYGRDRAINGGSESRTVAVEFSSPPRALGPVEARNLVRFTPAVAGLTFAVKGKTLEISGKFAWDTVYAIELVPTPISDRNGRPLEMSGESEVSIYFPRRPDFLRWNRAQGVVERFGPQMLPAEGRGDERVDLRIQRIDPLDRSYWPFPGHAVVVDESKRPPGPGEAPKKFEEVGRAISESEIGLQIASLGSPAVSKIVSLPLKREAGSASFGIDLSSELAFAGGREQPGTYLVGLRRLDRTSDRAWMRLQVTDLSLSTFEEPAAVRFEVTSLSSGRPVAGATIRVEGKVSLSGNAATWETLVSGTTDADGAFRWPAPGRVPGKNVEIARIVAEKGGDVLVLDPAHAPDSFANNQWSPTRSRWLQWTVEELSGRGAQPKILCHLFTERPVYRPEEPVHLKGYLRRRQGGRLHLESFEAFLVVDGPGNLTFRYPVTITPAGSFYHLFSEKKLPTGVYTAHLENKKKESFGQVRFRMEAYRIPQFEVQLEAPDQTPLDREFKASLLATYYAGGRVANRPVAWRVTQFPYTWTPKPRPGFVYSSDGRYSRTEKFEASPRLEKQTTTDAEGSASLSLNPSIEPTAQPRSYVIEATVTGADDQTVTATRSVLALPAFVLGLKAPRFLEKATAIDVEILAAAASGELLAGQEITLRLLSRQWHSHLRASDFSEGTARYTTDIVDEKVFEQKLKSASEPLKVSLPAAHAGVYVVEIEARDRLGRAQVVSVDLYAGGSGAVAWEKPVTRVFSVSADRDAYDPGTTAAILLKSPFQHASALAVVEAPEGNQYRWVAVEGGNATFHLPVLPSYVPRIPVHFLLLRGRLASSGISPGSRTDLAKPASFASTAWVNVNPVDNKVEVKLAYPEKARPGQKVQVDIRLSEPKGAPLPGEVTLWLVDQAVLALGKEQRLDPLPDFITAVVSHLEIRDTRDLVFGALPFAENPGGEERSKLAASSLLDRVTVRRNFKTVPYFNPAINVGADGKAVVSIALPDNLTNFKLRAKAVSGAERFGFATGQISVRLPVIAQPALPRFVRPGDRLTVSAIGRIVEGGGGAGSAEIHAEGLKISGDSKRNFTWTPNKPERLDFAAEVPTPSYTKEGKLSYDQVTVKLAVERASDHASDAFEVKLPLKDDRSTITRRSIVDLKPGVASPIPPVTEAARPGTVRREILVSNQPAIVQMAGGLDFLLRYPYGCTEQRISRARSEIALKSFRTLLHSGSEPDALERSVKETFEWIAGAVDSGGLVAYWPGNPGNVSLTAWALQFSVEAGKAGYAADPKLVAALERSLDAALRSDYSRFIDGEAFTERAWALSALAAAGKSNPAYAAELARKGKGLDLEAAAQVLQSFTASGDLSSPAVADLSSRLWEGLVFRLYQGKETYGGLQEKLTANPLILPSETRTVGEVTRALSSAHSRNERLSLLVDALVTLGRGDGWGTTNADAAALLALSERLKPPLAGGATGSVHVKIGASENDLPLSPGAPVGFLVETNAGEGDVSLRSSTGAIVLRAETSFIPAADGSHVAPESNGFVVRREILRIRKDGGPAERVSLSEPATALKLRIGEVLEEHVEIVNPQERHFVAITVPLAAGAEPLNPNLATAPPEAAPSGSLTRRPSYSEYLDDRVGFYYDTLPKGTYHFYFRTRATVAGSFTQPPAQAEMMYDGSVRGNSAGARIEIERGSEAP